MADGELLTIQQWRTHYAEAGAVFALSYLTPPFGQCRNDKEAYALLVGRKDVAQVLRGLSSLGLDGLPSGGHTRTGDVWIAWVQLARPGLLGDLLPSVLKPCGERAPGSYSLQAVTQRRASGNVLQVAAARWNDLNETPLSELTESAAGAVGDVAAGALSTTASAVVRGLLPLAIPLAIGLVLYARSRR